MTETVVLMLGEPGRWLRLGETGVIERGEGFDTLRRAELHIEERVVAVLPANETVIHHASLPGLAEQQARAAARLLVSEQTMSTLDTLHVAIGSETLDGERTVVAIDSNLMRAHLQALAAQGYDPDSVVAAPLLLPRPDAGLVRGDLGSGRVVRARDAAFADDDVLTPLIAGESAIEDLDYDALEVALAASVANPEVDLRQGPFARVRRWSIDWPLVRRIAVLGAVLGVLSILLVIVMIAKLNGAADRIEAQNAVAALAALPPGATINNPVAQLDERLAGLRGAGGGFLPLASAITAAVDATANVELAALTFDPSGALRATVRGSSPAELVAVETRLVAAGFTVQAGPVTTDAARPARELTVRRR